MFLIVYNLVQFLGFSWIFINMTVRLFIIGIGVKIYYTGEAESVTYFTENWLKHVRSKLFSDSLYDTFHTISDVMFFCQILALVEVLNAAFGVVKTGVIPTLIQVWDGFFLFCFLPEFKFPKVTDWAPIHIFCLCTRWSEGILSSSSFLVVWRKCTTSQLCSLFSICGVLLRFLGKYAFSYCLQ